MHSDKDWRESKAYKKTANTLKVRAKFVSDNTGNDEDTKADKENNQPRLPGKEIDWQFTSLDHFIKFHQANHGCAADCQPKDQQIAPAN